MLSKPSAIRSLIPALTCALLVCGFSLFAADATGTWSWTMQGRGGQPAQGQERKTTLKLKVEGEKLTGTLITPGRQGGDPRETAIEEGKVKGNEISFQITREFNNQKMVQKYSGKVDGDAIKGKIAFDRNGETQSRDWEAKREVEKK